MEDKLSKEEVLHVADLARIEVSEEEIETYQIKLKELLNEVEKIESINDNDDTLYIDNDYNFIINTITEENIDINYKLKDL